MPHMKNMKLKSKIKYFKILAPELRSLIFSFWARLWSESFLKGGFCEVYWTKYLGLVFEHGMAQPAASTCP